MTVPTGPAEQVAPDIEQVVGGEVQQLLEEGVLPLIWEGERRIAPLPARVVRVGVPGVGVDEVGVPGVPGAPAAYGFPIARLDRYEGADSDWQTLLEWTIPIGFTGDLHEISLRANNPAATRYRIYIAGRDLYIPDRQPPGNFTLPWRSGTLPEGTSVSVQVRSMGDRIIVSGHLTGSER